MNTATSVTANSPVSATFSRDPVVDTIVFDLVNSTGQSVPGTTTYDASKKVVTFSPTGPLLRGETYSASLSASAPGVGAMSSPAVWTFTTARPDAVAGVCPCTLFNDSDSPATPSADDTKSVNLGVAFTPDTNGVVTGIRFYKSPGNTGPHTIGLWTAAGAGLATAAVQTAGASGWQTAMFGAPVSVSAGTTYVPSYNAPVGRYSYTLNQLAQPLDRTPLHTPGNAGRYAYGASAAPSNASSANYFVDPIFTVAAGTAPGVTAVTPTDASTSVPTSSTVAVRFDTTIQPGSTTFSLKDSTGTVVSGSQGNPLGSRASFVPSAPLAAGTAYTVTISGAKNLGGTPMTSPVSTTFTTAGVTTCPLRRGQFGDTSNERLRRRRPGQRWPTVHCRHRWLYHQPALLPGPSEYRCAYRNAVQRNRSCSGHADLRYRRPGLAVRQLRQPGPRDGGDDLRRQHLHAERSLLLRARFLHHPGGQWSP